MKNTILLESIEVPVGYIRMGNNLQDWYYSMAFGVELMGMQNKALQVTDLNVTVLVGKGPCHLKRPVPELIR